MLVGYTTKTKVLTLPWFARVERSIPTFDQILISPSSPANKKEKKKWIKYIYFSKVEPIFIKLQLDVLTTFKPVTRAVPSWFHLPAKTAPLCASTLFSIRPILETRWNLP